MIQRRRRRGEVVRAGCLLTRGRGAAAGSCSDDVFYATLRNVADGGNSPA